jgi:putative transcriptional regulator
MIRFRLAELMADHQFKHGRRISVKELSEATGINRNTLSRMSNTRGYSTSTDTLDKLCKFFGCDVGDLARYIEDEPATSSAQGGSVVDSPGAADVRSVDPAPSVKASSTATKRSATTARKRGAAAS